MQKDEVKELNVESESSPIFKSWKRLYAFLLIQTAALIIVFYLFTRFFK